MKKGFTLIEALVTIGIIALLAGILLPVLVSSKRAALRTDNISKMHQLGLAAAMYQDRYEGAFPLSDTQLVDAGLVPRELCDSNRDMTATGIANDLAKWTAKRYGNVGEASSVPYKNSFVGPKEFNMGQEVFQNYVMTGPASGWLIDATESDRGYWPTPTQWSGNYRRLCTDGSVVVRQYKDFDCYNDGKRQKCRMAALLFVDPSPAFEELQKSDDQQASSQ